MKAHNNHQLDAPEASTIEHTPYTQFMRTNPNSVIKLKQLITIFSPHATETR